jgi:hypothetical protein
VGGMGDSLYMSEAGGGDWDNMMEEEGAVDAGGELDAASQRELERRQRESEGQDVHLDFHTDLLEGLEGLDGCVRTLPCFQCIPLHYGVVIMKCSLLARSC